jgi:predicted nucleic acid-binding protein
MPARAWELRHTVRGWDAMYVTLAELVDATVLTMDRRLARAVGPRCDFDVIGGT